MLPAVDPTAGFDHTITIAATPARIMAAFFDAKALSVWWQTVRSVTAPRPLGVFAVEWEPTPEPDDILGRLGGVFHGTVMEYVPGCDLLVADAWWLPPDGEPIGPMSLEVSCRLEGHMSRLRIRQRGFEDSPRWRRYYEVIAHGWLSSLSALKTYVEEPGPG